MVIRILLLAATLVGCSSDDAKSKKSAKDNSAIELPSGKSMPRGTATTATFAFSDVAYLTAASVDNATLQTRVDQANDFYFAIAKHAAGSARGNFVLSPLSIQTAFALLYPATEPASVVAGELVEALRFDADQEKLAGAMHGYQLALEKAFSDPPAERTLTLSVVNQVWTDTAFGLQSPYLDTIKKFHNSGVGILPIREQTEASRTTINDFIAHNTEGLIKDLLPAGALSPDSAAVLTNSVYMLADWAEPFAKESTAKATFNNSDGTTSQPDMMRDKRFLAYGETSTYQTVSIPYAGNRAAMMIVLPRTAADYAQIADSFSASDLKAALAAQNLADVSLSLPKFNIEWGTSSLKDALNQLGLKQAFEPTANHFSRLLTRNGAPLGGESVTWIENVFHKAKIIVDEKGTEAAAATAIVIAETDSAPIDDPKIFNVDRPALFFVYETEHGGILFAGRLEKL